MLKYYLDSNEVDEKIYNANIRATEKRYKINDACPVKEIVIENDIITAHIIESDLPSDLEYFCPECGIKTSSDECVNIPINSSHEEYEFIHTECGKKVEKI